MTLSIAIKDQSQIAEARREAAAIAQRNGFKEDDSGRVALIATELASNLIKHGRGGELLIGTFEDNEGSGIELLAIDQGPGIGNVEQCLRDGYSSAGTAGNGLGAVIRQSQLVDIASWPGLGTGVLARIQPETPSPQRYLSRTGWGAVSVAMPGQDVCGDSWSVAANGATTYFVADGLGHGQEAADASVEAVRLFHRFNGHRVPTLLDYVHGGLRSTRGAAVSIARFDPGTRQGHILRCRQRRRRARRERNAAANGEHAGNGRTQRPQNPELRLSRSKKASSYWPRTASGPVGTSAAIRAFSRCIRR